MRSILPNLSCLPEQMLPCSFGPRHCAGFCPRHGRYRASSRNGETMPLSRLLLVTLTLVASSCTSYPPPEWRPTTDVTEAEYEQYLGKGTCQVSGQAFLRQRGGGVVTAAGSIVTLDPATSTAIEWWKKAGTIFVHRHLTPPSPNFHKARRTTPADADGRFKFVDVRPGKYYVRTEVIWHVGIAPQGGLVGQLVEVKQGRPTEVILNKWAE